MRVSLLLALLLGAGAPRAARAAAIGPDQGEIALRLLSGDGDEPSSIEIPRDHIEAHYAGCTIQLRHPLEADASPTGWIRHPTARFVVAAEPRCSSALVARVVARVIAGESAFRWGGGPVAAAGGARTLADHRRSIVWQAGAALVLLVVLALLALRALRAARPSPRAVAAVAASLAGLLALDAWAPFHDGDEPINFAFSLVAPFTHLQLPDYTHPTLYTYLSSLLYALLIASYALLSARPLDDAAARVLLFHHADLLLVSRAISSVAWVGLGALLSRVARSVAGPLAAAAALLIALPAGLRLATDYSPYALAILLAHASLLAGPLRPPEAPAPSPRAATLAGALAGAAFSCHWLAALFAPAFLPSLRSLPWRDRATRALIFAAAFFAVFAVTNFRIFVEPASYVAVARYRLSEIATPEFATVADRGPLYYLGRLAIQPGIVAGAIAFAFVIARRRLLAADRRVVFSAGLALWLLLALSAFSTRFDRYLLYALPSLGLTGGWALAEVARRHRPPWRLAGLALLCALCLPRLLDGAGGLFHDSTTLRGGDPIAVSTAWLRARPEGETVVVSSGVVGALGRAAELHLLSRDLLRTLERTFARAAGHERLRFPGFALDPAGPFLAASLDSADWLYEIQWYDGGARPTERHLDDGRCLPYVSTWEAAGLVHSIARLR